LVCDWRKDLDIVHALKGSKGSIKDIKISNDLVATVGLDRFLRVSNYKTREVVQNIYLKQKLTKLIIEEGAIGKAKEEEEKEIKVEVEEKRRRNTKEQRSINCKN